MKFKMIIKGLVQDVWASHAEDKKIVLCKEEASATIYTNEQLAFNDRKFMFTQLPPECKIEFVFINDNKKGKK